jgi:hypothetical protein
MIEFITFCNLPRVEIVSSIERDGFRLSFILPNYMVLRLIAAILLYEEQY